MEIYVCGDPWLNGLLTFVVSMCCIMKFLDYDWLDMSLSHSPYSAPVPVVLRVLADFWEEH